MYRFQRKNTFLFYPGWRSKTRLHWACRSADPGLIYPDPYTQVSSPSHSSRNLFYTQCIDSNEPSPLPLSQTHFRMWPGKYHTILRKCWERGIRMTKIVRCRVCFLFRISTFAWWAGISPLPALRFDHAKWLHLKPCKAMRYGRGAGVRVTEKPKTDLCIRIRARTPGSSLFIFCT